MAIRRVYLDQHAWIRLSAVRHGKLKDPALAEVLDIVRSSVDLGLASYPLSSAHYLETYRRGDPGSRRRLGTFMAETSRFHTIAGAPDVLRSEVQTALHRLAGLTPPPTPSVFGIGYAHAFGLPGPEYEDNTQLWGRLVSQVGREKAVEFWETTLLAGPSQRLPFADIKLPARVYDQRQLDYERQTAENLQKEGHSGDLARRLVLAQEAGDVFELVNELNADMGLDLQALLGTDDQMTAFILDLPAMGVISRMRWTSHQNPTFKRELNDLTDVTALGMAAAYCDIVVSEKHWGDVLNRFSNLYPARVVRRLADLPPALLT